MKPITRYYFHKIIKGLSIISLFFVPMIYLLNYFYIEIVLQKINKVVGFYIHGVIPVSIYVIIVFLYLKRIDRNLAGLQGEARGQRQLKSLKKADMTIFSNVKLPRPYKGELDFVLVGQSNVFIVEIKNIRGKVTGKVDDKYLIRKKISGQNNIYTDKIYNPLRQVSTHVYKLSKHLRNLGKTPYIYGMAYFVHPTSKLEIEGGNNVFHISDKNSLLNYVRSKDDSTIKMTNRDLIIKYLEENSVKI